MAVKARDNAKVGDGERPVLKKLGIKFRCGPAAILAASLARDAMSILHVADDRHHQALSTRPQYRC
jgi:hypothetical protein